MFEVSPYIRESLRDLKAYTTESDSAAVIVNANECNYGFPAEVQISMEQAFKELALNRYPAHDTESLETLISTSLGIVPQQVMLGNGSSELLEQCCYALSGGTRKIAYPYPSFSMYGVYTTLADAEAEPYPLTQDGYVDAETVLEFCRKEKPSLLILCNPNNPTGNFNSLTVIEKILAGCACPVVVDEAYIEFCGGHDLNYRESSLTLLSKYDNFLCLRTFSKAYGAAGIRLGYAVGSKQLINVVSRRALPYHINAVTMSMGKVLWQQRQLFIERTERLVAERKILTDCLEMNNFTVYDSSTNFVLFAPKGGLIQELLEQGEIIDGGDDKANKQRAGRYVWEYLLSAGILARDFTAHPLLTGYIRLSVGTMEENILIREVAKSLSRKIGGQKP